jgi:Nucleotidyl transferase AbiEii toxin, Type IV TA system
VNALFAAAAEVQQFFAAQRWDSAVIGGVAVQRWGDPRQTRDVDLTLITGLGGEVRFVDAILDRYQGRLADTRRFALDHRVLLVETRAGIPIDISLGALPFEMRVVERASPFEVGPGASLNTCSAEDLVVLKAFAGRAQDWLDVEAVLVRQGARLDRRLVHEELTPLLELKEDAVAADRLAALFAKHPV